MDPVLRDATSLESCCYEQYILGQKQLMRPLDFKDENDYEYEI